MSRVRKFLPIDELYKIRHSIPDGTVEEDYICQYMSLIDSHIFRQVPDECKTESLCLYAVGCHEQNLYYIPESMRTAQMYEVAVDNNLDMIGSVPEKFMTFRLAYKACNVKPHWLFHHDAIPINQLLVDFLPNNINHFTNLRSWKIRKPERLSSICRLYLARDGLVLEWVLNPTLEECQTAFQQNPFALRWIPEDKQNEMVEEIFDRVQTNQKLWPFLAKSVHSHLAKLLIEAIGAPDDLLDVIHKEVLPYLFKVKE